MAGRFPATSTTCIPPIWRPATSCFPTSRTPSASSRARACHYACAAYGIDGWETIDKPELAKAIGEGRWRDYGQPTVLQYCEEDVRASAELLRRQLTGYRHFAPVDAQRVMHWSNYSAKTVALIQAKGMPIDLPLWNLVQENKTAVIAALIRRFDPSQGGEDPIYAPDGSFSSRRFEQWLISAGIPYWPRLDSGALQLDSDAFRMMYAAHPAIENIHALRDALGVIVRARIPIGPDGRNRPSLFPFGTASSRNAQAKSLYNAHASMRSFMKFAPDKIGLYLDWRTQEVGVAAARSGDAQLAEDYLSGDIYHALARLCGLTTETDATRWKGSPEGQLQRPRMKPLQLGINYGMGVRSLSRGLNRHPLIGSEIIIRHRQRYRHLLGLARGGGHTSHAGAPNHLQNSTAGHCTSATRRTSAPSTIFRCNRAAPRCCGWQPTGYVRPT